MISLSSIIKQFEADFLEPYQDQLLPSHFKALGAMKHCRTSASPRMLACCTECEQQILMPHSCGHRLCPHCQNHESEQWIERQLQKQVPAEYFLITFTLPAELRPLAWWHQRIVFDLIMHCAWETMQRFAEQTPGHARRDGRDGRAAYSFTCISVSPPCPSGDARCGH